MSRALVDHLKLEKKLYRHPYAIGSIKKGSCIKIMDQCHVPTSIGKFYQDSVSCDVVDMDKYHILLGRLWSHDVDTTHEGKENIYIHLEGQKSCHDTNSTYSNIYTTKASSLVSLCNPFYPNSRASSFEERRTDVGWQSQKTRHNRRPKIGFG